MVTFQAPILRAGDQGAAMAGWADIDVPQAVAHQLKPDYRRAFRVRGEIDGQAFRGLTLIPKGGGDFFLAINGAMRKRLKKGVGDIISLRLEEDVDFVIQVPADLERCLADAGDDLTGRFLALPKSHRHYFINYINAAKTESTRAKRIAMTVEAMLLGLDFGAMIRLDKSRRTDG